MTSKEHPTATITTPNSTPGQSGRFGSERVAAFRRNQWPLSSECAVHTRNTAMAKPATDTRESNQEDYDRTDKISPDLDSILTELDKALEQISDRQDKHQIVRALTAAVIAQEMSRITVTKSKMVSGDLSSIDTQRLLSDWQVLSRHYAGAKHQDVLDAGIIQLRKLDLDDAQRVIHEIRCAVEPTVNWAIEEKTTRLSP